MLVRPLPADHLTGADHFGVLQSGRLRLSEQAGERDAARRHHLLQQPAADDRRNRHDRQLTPSPRQERCVFRTAVTVGVVTVPIMTVSVMTVRRVTVRVRVMAVSIVPMGPVTMIVVAVSVVARAAEPTSAARVIDQ